MDFHNFRSQNHIQRRIPPLVLKTLFFFRVLFTILVLLFSNFIVSFFRFILPDRGKYRGRGRGRDRGRETETETETETEAETGTETGTETEAEPNLI